MNEYSIDHYYGIHFKRDDLQCILNLLSENVKYKKIVGADSYVNIDGARVKLDFISANDDARGYITTKSMQIFGKPAPNIQNAISTVQTPQLITHENINVHRADLDVLADITRYLLSSKPDLDLHDGWAAYCMLSVYD